MFFLWNLVYYVQAIEWISFKITLNERSGPKSEKKLTGQIYGPGQNYVFRFGPGRARTEISISLSGRAGPRLQPCCPDWTRTWKIRPVQTSNSVYLASWVTKFTTSEGLINTKSRQKAALNADELKNYTSAFASKMKIQVIEKPRTY